MQKQLQWLNISSDLNNVYQKLTGDGQPKLVGLGDKQTRTK